MNGLGHQRNSDTPTQARRSKTGVSVEGNRLRRKSDWANGVHRREDNIEFSIDDVQKELSDPLLPSERSGRHSSGVRTNRRFEEWVGTVYQNKTKEEDQKFRVRLKL